MGNRVANSVLNCGLDVTTGDIIRTAVSYCWKVFKNISTTFSGVEEVGMLVNTCATLGNVRLHVITKGVVWEGYL